MQRVKNNEFGYLGNPSVKRDGVEASFTKEEVKDATDMITVAVKDYLERI